MDIRAVGKGFEEYKLRGGNTSRITYVRGRVAEITEGPNQNPVVTYEDTRERKIKSQEFYIVSLATACKPSKSIIGLSKLLGFELDEYNFVKTSPVSPVDTSVPGVFVCSCAGVPTDVPVAVTQASSAAGRAAGIVFKLYSEKEQAVA